MIGDVTGHNPRQAAEIIRGPKPLVELPKIIEVACIKPRIKITHWIIKWKLGIHDNDDRKYEHHSGHENLAQVFTWTHLLGRHLTWSCLELLSVRKITSHSRCFFERTE